MHSTVDKSGWTAVSSSANDIMHPNKAVDGVLSRWDYWGSLFHSGEISVPNEWIEVNTGVPQTVSSVAKL